MNRESVFKIHVSHIKSDRTNSHGKPRKGCDVILVEREGVCDVLEPYADRRGVALVNSRGFATEYAKQLLDLSEMLQGNLFLLTDYDASGLLIAEKLKDILRLGVDPRMISRLGLSREDLEERYDTKGRKCS